ncbi:NAD+ diphosphatase [Sphingobium fontiphilum]|uniref:NAD(+) diphosphatase n=1 Tax=Sphingobium fontiphilum TaxID=944425 RepID=A0A7W6DGZ1_9SPHN|nr:NAD(+) diphosphatase [Sphingobium fontiphilum]MBB3982853.1 NAD+ diphosphatase [Sphingobium fontiphilum]
MPADLSMPGFVGGTLDRADQIRTSPEKLAEAFAQRSARRLVLDGLDPVADGERLACEPIPRRAALAEHVLLGVDDDGPLFAPLARDIPHGAVFAPAVWELAGVLAPDQLALYGAARSLIDWHARHPFCARCGHETRPEKGGWARLCGSCGAEHFPRVDPVTIMLAEHRGRILLGRQHRFPPGRYSALAGFVEPGETIEEAVARELWEEAGIRVDQVRYVMSQPWPFPASLMIACIAQARDDRLTLDESEIEHAFWCDAAGVRAALAGEAGAPFIAPPPMAVARHLLVHWLARQDASA